MNSTPTALQRFFRRLATSFLVLFFVVQPFTMVFGAEVGHNPQPSSYDVVVDGIGQSPSVSVVSPSGALPDSTPISALSSPAQVDESSGAFTYAYNLTLPAGPGGITPPLDFTYDSRRRNYDGAAGIGFDFGTPFISRINKYGVDRMYEDVSFSSSLHGELVKLDKEQDVFGIYGVKDGYGRYSYNRDYSWTFTDKSGVSYVFGAKSTEREFIASDDTKISKWSLSSIKDVDGRAYEYVYDKVSGRLYPIAIFYPQDIYKVDIGWNKTPQVTPTYENGYSQNNSRRPTQVVLTALGIQYRKHTFKFNEDTFQLERITDSVLGSTDFQYSEIENPRSAVVYENPAWHVNQYRIDIDGDGVNDMYRHEYNAEPHKTLLTVQGVTYSNMPAFDGFADVNNDGTLDGYTNNGCYRSYISEGDFLEEDCSIGIVPTGNRLIFEDVNNDGILEQLVFEEGQLKIYVFSDGRYTLDPAYKAVGATMSTNLDALVAIFDINGDGQKDFLYGENAYLNRGGYFEYSNSYAVDTSNEYYFPNAKQLEYTYKLTPVDYNNDKLFEIKIEESWKEKCSSQGWCDAKSEQIFLNSGHGWVAATIDYWKNFESFTQEKIPLITKITQSNLDIEIQYGLEKIIKSNILGSVKKVIVVKSIMSPYGGANYSYGNGKFFFNAQDNKSEFAGFGNVTKADALGRKVVSYFHQGNGSNVEKGEFEDSQYKIGRMYRQELYGGNGDLLKFQTTKWIQADLGSSRFLVVPEYTSQVVDRVATAVGYTYDTAIGEIVREYNFGDVAVNTDGSFSDAGNDTVITSYRYKTNGTLVVREEEKSERNGELLSHMRYTHNAQLTKLVKEEQAQMSGSFISRMFTYNLQGNLDSSTDYLGNKTTYFYDDYGFLPSRIVNPLGQEVTIAYDYVNQKPDKVVDISGVEHRYKYDALGQELEYYRNGLKERSLYSTDNYHKYYFARHLQTSSGSNVEDTYSESRIFYDGLMRPIHEYDQNSGVIETVYDQYGRVQEKTIPHFGFTTDSKKIFNTYDDLDRITTQTTSDGVTRYEYEGRIVHITNPQGVVKTMEYDSAGNIASITEGGFVTRYAYDGNNNLIRIEDAEGNIKEQSFDMLGYKLYASDLHVPAKSEYGRYYFVYDSNGNITQEIKPGNITMFTSYDALGRIIDKTAGDDRISYTYDTCLPGKLCSEERGNYYRKLYKYTQKGQVQSIVETIHDKTVTVSYEYLDKSDLVSKIYYPDFTISYTYKKDKISQIYKDGVPLLNSVVYEGGRLIRIVYANGISTENVYDENHGYRLLRRTTRNAQGKKLQDASYTYDSLGQITSLSDTSDTLTRKEVVYEYDELRRLINATYQIDGIETTESFSYSPTGNILSSPQGVIKYGQSLQDSVTTEVNQDVLMESIDTSSGDENQQGVVEELSVNLFDVIKNTIMPTVAHAEEFENSDVQAFTLEGFDLTKLQSIDEIKQADLKCKDGVSDIESGCEVEIVESENPPEVVDEELPEEFEEICQSYASSIGSTEGCVSLQSAISTGRIGSLEQNNTQDERFTLAHLVDELGGKLISIYETSEGFLISLVNGSGGSSDVRIRQDVAGKVLMVQGTKNVQVVFEKPLDVVPVINITPEGYTPGASYVTSVTEEGFIINTTTPAQQDIVFHYYAFGVPDDEIQTKGVVPEKITNPKEEREELPCPQGYQKDFEGNCIPREQEGEVDFSHPHAVRQIQGMNGDVVNFEYDARGNLVSRGVNLYSWSAQNELLSVQLNDRVTYYNYSPGHDRVYSEEVVGGMDAPTVSKTYFFSTLINRNGVEEVSLPYGVILKDGQPTYTFSDHLGTVQVVANMDGDPVGAFDTYVYGNQRAYEGEDVPVYALHEYGGDLVYMNARYYSPLASSFISQDPTVLVTPERYVGDPLQLNAYGYARGNPVMNNDPTGLFMNGLYDPLVHQVYGNLLGAYMQFKEQAVHNQGIGRVNYGLSVMEPTGTINDIIGAVRGVTVWGKEKLDGEGRVNSLVSSVIPVVSTTMMKRIARSGGFIDEIDGQGGHIRARHVDISDASLRIRATALPEGGAATKYYSEVHAEYATKSVLQVNSAKINSWLQDIEVGKTKGFTGKIPIPVGYGYLNQADGLGKISRINTVRVAIKNLGNNNYRVITSYPLIK